MIRGGLPRDAGLTLIELLVVLAVLGLLGGLTAAGLRTASEGWQRIVRHNSDSEELLAIKAMLRELFSQIYPQRIGESGRSIVRFVGTSDRIEFLAPLAQRFGAKDIVLYAMSFPGDGSLRVSWQLDRQSEPGRKRATPPATEELLEGFSDGHFSYYGQADKDDVPQWWSAWQNRPGLPKLLRVHFVRHGQKEELIAAPLVTAGTCAVNGLDVPCSE